MSADAMSRQEAEAGLLFKETGARSAGKPRPSGLESYDFRRPTRLSKDRMRALEAVYGGFAESVGSWLRGRLNGPVELTVVGLEQLGVEEFTALLPTPCASFVLDVARQEGVQGVIDCDHELAFFLVERLLGGSGMPAVQERPLTPVERMLVRLVAERIATQLESAWRERVEVGLKLSRFEALPEMLRIGPRDEALLVASLEARAPGLASGLRIALPLSALESFLAEPVAPAAPVRAPTRETAERQAAEVAVRTARVQVGVRLPTLQLRMGDLAELRVGQTLPTGLSRDVEVDVTIGGQRRFHGLTGRIGGKLAVRISEAIRSGPKGGPGDNRRP